MKNIYILLLLLTISFGAYSQTTDNNTIGFDFYPTSTYGQVIHHTYYSLSYSEKDEQAEWVAYKLTGNNISGNVKRKNNFKADKKVTTESAQLYDYKGSGYDRGHLAPAGSMKINKISMSESFYMSNMSPQNPSFNRGIWKRLEGKVRYWAEINDSIFVVSGPILDNPLGTIGKNKVTIPSAYYKTLIGYKNGKVKGIGFIIPNEKSGKSLYKYVASINDIEEITGIDFYYKIDKKIQEEVEANKDVKLWFLKK